MRTTHTQQDGITLLITLLLMGVLLGISASLINITLKQFQFAGITYASERAFQAASSGAECAMYFDKIHHRFDVPASGEQSSAPNQVNCMQAGLVSMIDASNLDSSGTTGYTDPFPGNGMAVAGGEQRLLYESWGTGSNVVSTEISIYKFIGGQDVLVNGIRRRSPNNPADNFCPVGSDGCTVIVARGYNTPWASRGDRTVEREIVVSY